MEKLIQIWCPLVATTWSKITTSIKFIEYSLCALIYALVRASMFMYTYKLVVAKAAPKILKIFFKILFMLNLNL